MNRAPRPSLTFTAGALALALALGVAACGTTGINALPDTADETQPAMRRGSGGVTRFLARNVAYRLDKNISMQLVELNADVLLKDPAGVFVPANKNDYAIQIHSAKVVKGPKDMEWLMNTYVFNDADSPLKELKIKTNGTKLGMSGKMKKGVWVGFEMEGDLSATPEGKIRLHPTLVKSLGIRVDGLMGLIGLDMAKLLKTKAEKGVALDGNDILMDVSKLFPPPRMLGKVSRVEVRPNQVIIEMNDGKAQPFPPMPVPQAPSFLAMWGGDVLINKTLNLDAKMQILDASPATPQVFALDRYREALESGYIVATKDGHLIAYQPDALGYDGPFPRFAPPTFPIPGQISAPSDMGSADSRSDLTD